MKTFVLTYVSVFVIFSACAQNVALKLFIEDSAGRKDTIIFGVNDTSTLGVDTVLGEINIFGAPHDSLDIRIIQRDSANFNCIRESNYSSLPTANLYFPNNIDSKIDFRPFGEFESVYNNFEIYIHAVSYPVTIWADFTQIQGSYLEGYSSIHLLDSNCNTTETQSIYYNSAKDSLFILPDSTYNTLVAHFEHEVGIKEKKLIKSLIKIYPNPSKGMFTVTFFEQFTGLISISDVTGKIIYSEDLTGVMKIEKLLNASQGIYFVHLFSNEKAFLTAEKIIIY